MMRNREKAVWAGVLCLIMIIAMCVFDPVFMTNDDVLMQGIASGAVTGKPDGHMYFVQYPLSGILSFLYRIVSNIPWYTLLLIGSVYWAMFEFFVNFIFVFRGDNKVVNRLIQVMGLYITSVMFISCCLNLQFTIVSGILAGIAGFLLIIKGKNWSSVCMLLLSFMLRQETFLVSVPFIAVVSIWRIISEKKQLKREISNQIVFWSILIITVVTSASLNHMLYSNDEWKQYNIDNNNRVALYDYTDIIRKDKYADKYEELELTDIQFELISGYNLLLDSEIESEFLKQLAEKIDAKKEKNNNMGKTIMRYIMRVSCIDLPYGQIVIIGYLFLAIILLKKNDRLKGALLGSLVFGRTLIWLYLIWQGRTPARVIVALYYMEILVLLGIILYVFNANKCAIMQYIKKKTRYSIIIVTVIIFVGEAIPYFWGNIVYDNREDIKNWQAMKEYCDERKEDIFLFETTSFGTYSEYIFQQPSSNMILLGGWMAYNPLMEQIYEKYGVSDCSELLLNYDNAHIVFDAKYSADWLEEYLQGRFGECELILEDTVKYSDDGEINIYMVE